MLAPITPPPMMSASARRGSALRPLERRLPDEGVGPDLEADGRLGAVPGEHPGVGWISEEPLADRTDEGPPVAAGKVGPPDRAAEQDVAGDETLRRDKGHAAGRMPGGVDRTDRKSRDPDLLPVFDGVGDGDNARPRKSDRHRLLGAAVVERAVLRVEPDRRSGDVVEPLHHEDVVDVRVGEENALHVQGTPGDFPKDAFALDRGIHDDRIPRARRGEEIEVVVERAYGEPLHPHGQALQAVIAVMPNIGSPTMSTSLKPACSRSEQSSERVSAPAKRGPWVATTLTRNKAASRGSDLESSRRNSVTRSMPPRRSEFMTPSRTLGMSSRLRWERWCERRTRSYSPPGLPSSGWPSSKWTRSSSLVRRMNSSASSRKPGRSRRV